jgi:hypothetical protein
MIVFSCNLNGEICVMNADGSGRRVLARTSGFAAE